MDFSDTLSYPILLCHCHCWNDWWWKKNLFHSWILYFCYKPIVYQTMHKLSESASIWCIYIRSWSFKLGCWTLRIWAFRSLNRMLLYVEYNFEHTSFWRYNLYCNENHPGFIWGIIYFCTIHGFFIILKKAFSELMCTQQYD